VAAGALLVAGLVVWQAPHLMALGRALASALAALAGSVTLVPSWRLPALPSALGGEAVRLALLVTAASLLPPATFALYRWSERLAGPRPRAR
jgi:hypothetical protein